MTEWLTLKRAAALLGVHPSTLRRWSDQGRVPVSRTKGGHRRFERAVIERMATESAARASGPPMASVDARPAWRASFDGESIDEIRQLGQRLLGIMLQYVTRENEEERFLGEGRSAGLRYGREAARAGMAMLEVVEAFLYFRSRFTEATVQLPSFPRDNEDGELRRLNGRIDRFMNEVLLGTIEGYEEAAEEQPDPAP